MLKTENYKSLASAVYELIKRDIVRCRWAPGAELTEGGLAAHYGFGKTPVRDALGRLAQEGLVQVLPRRGYLVSPINVKDVQDMFALRLLLEPEAARLAAGLVDAEQIRRLDEICSAGYDPADPESSSRFLEANTEFHVTIARASGNDRLAAIVAQLLCEAERVFHVGLRLRNRSEEMAHEHRDLINALVVGDGEAAARIDAAQIVAARKMVMDGLLSNHGAITVSLV